VIGNRYVNRTLKRVGVISYHKRLWEDQQRVGFQSMSEFPTNTIVTRWPRCATFSIEISYFVFTTLSCQRFYLQWINPFGILDLSFIIAYHVLNMWIAILHLMIKIENWNATQIVPIHSSEYFSIINMYRDRSW